MFPELITELLQDGYSVNFSAPGHSMYPTIMANENILVAPIDPAAVRMGDIILYRTNGSLIAHRVTLINKMNKDAINPFPDWSFILKGDASATYDEPVKDEQVLGKVISIERNGCSIDPYSITHKLGCLARRLTSRLKAILN
jgi:signal peptidase I